MTEHLISPRQTHERSTTDQTRISCRLSLAIGLAALAVCSGLITTPATAGGGDVAAGVLGGLAVGALVGSAAAQPRYYAPERVYVPRPHCWVQRRHIWDGYGYVIDRVRVCE
jgi:hypothetical protein